MFRQLGLFGAAEESAAGTRCSSRGGSRRRGGSWRTRGASLNSMERMASSHREASVDGRGPVACAVPTSVLEAIRVINPSANVEYLAGFDESALRLYLAHLESSRLPRGRGARWERPGDTRAIRVCRPPEEV